MTSLATPAAAVKPWRLDRAIVLTAVACGGAGAAVLTAWSVAQSPILYRATESGVLRGAYVAAWVAAGAYSWWRRPASHLGPILAGVGFVYALTSLNASGDDLGFTLGMIVWAGFVVLLFYTTLCFPRTRPGSPLEQVFVRVIWSMTLLLWTLILLFAEKLPKGAQFVDCESNCPPNALQVFNVPEAIGTALNAAYTLALAISLTGIVLVLVGKARSPSRLRRRAVEPLSYIMAAFAAVAVLNLFMAALLPETKTAFWMLEAALAISAPLAIVIGQSRGGMLSVGRLVAAISAKTVTRDGLQALMRESLADPTLVLALAEPETGTYVDVDGRHLELPAADEEGRAVTEVVHGGRTVAAIVHDPTLYADAAVVTGLVASALLLLENAQLVDELRASRGRIVTATEDARLQLERDLHDGAQQRLMGIQIKLALLSEHVADPALAAELDEVVRDAAAAADDLRGLAHGIYPTVLRERGLADALRSLARRTPLTVEVVDEGIGRCAPAVEAAIYFCAAEAIQNATKHAGLKARVTVTLERRSGDAAFAVVDDGTGFDPTTTPPGIGLVSMSDRIGAVGGEVDCVSSLGRGTAVRGRVPCPTAAGTGG